MNRLSAPLERRPSTVLLTEVHVLDGPILHLRHTKTAIWRGVERKHGLSSALAMLSTGRSST